MEHAPTIDSDDEGKAVYDTDGNRVGMVVRVEGDRVHVEPDPDTTESVAARLGWTFMLRGSEESYDVDAASVESVRDDRVIVEVVEP